MCLTVCLYICLTVCLYMCPDRLSVHVSDRLSVHMSDRLSVHVSDRLSVHMSDRLSVHMSDRVPCGVQRLNPFNHKGNHHLLPVTELTTLAPDDVTLTQEVADKIFYIGMDFYYVDNPRFHHPRFYPSAPQQDQAGLPSDEPHLSRSPSLASSNTA